MKAEVFITVSGVFHVVAAGFDASWPCLFNWDKTLAPVDGLQRSHRPISGIARAWRTTAAPCRE